MHSTGRMSGREVPQKPCEGCARCCYLAVEIVECVDADVPDELTQWNYSVELPDRGVRTMRQHADGKCVALANGLCSIYELRPTECRQFELGQHRCLALQLGVLGTQKA